MISLCITHLLYKPLLSECHFQSNLMCLFGDHWCFQHGAPVHVHVEMQAFVDTEMKSLTGEGSRQGNTEKIIHLFH